MPAACRCLYEKARISRNSCSFLHSANYGGKPRHHLEQEEMEIDRCSPALVILSDATKHLERTVRDLSEFVDNSVIARRLPMLYLLYGIQRQRNGTLFGQYEMQATTKSCVAGRASFWYRKLAFQTHYIVSVTGVFVLERRRFSLTDCFGAGSRHTAAG